ncbi:hypothetical protein DL93DRAFT_592973 [Clavulina sp. PMI_390]|nr:hypothetical protein DL93DRAFT_592973 [Clavulina sp. PMI_390]
MDSIYQLLVELVGINFSTVPTKAETPIKPQTVQQSGPAELRAYAYVLYCKVQSFCARFQIQPSESNSDLRHYLSSLALLDGNQGRPRDAAFLTEYQRYSAVLSRLQSAPLMLQSRWGIAAQEVISPCNPDALYLSVLTQLTRLLLSDLLAQGGDDTAHNNCVAAAKEIARYARIVRSCGKPTGSEAPPGPHEIQAPFMIMACFSSLAHLNSICG